MSYLKVGNISLWEGTSDNPKAPVLRGEVEIAEGTTYSVALWLFEGAETGPKFKGSLEVQQDD
jgi:hypothetical protein